MALNEITQSVPRHGHPTGGIVAGRSRKTDVDTENAAGGRTAEQLPDIISSDSWGVHPDTSMRLGNRVRFDGPAHSWR